MKEPTLKQAAHFLNLINQSKITRNLLQDVFNSGLLPILLEANLAEIDKFDFMRVCGLIAVPKPMEDFQLRINGVNRDFRLVHMLPYACLEILKRTILLSDYFLPEKECLEAFRERFPKSDGGIPICLAEDSGNPMRFQYPILSGKKGSSWEQCWRNSHTNTRHTRCLVEMK